MTAYAGERVDAGELQLSEGVFLSGRVVDEAGAPVVGAAVTAAIGERSGEVIPFAGVAEPGANDAVLTDVNGRFVVDRYAVGPWALTVRSDDHVTEAWRVRPSSPVSRSTTSS